MELRFAGIDSAELKIRAKSSVSNLNQFESSAHLAALSLAEWALNDVWMLIDPVGWTQIPDRRFSCQCLDVKKVLPSFIIVRDYFRSIKTPRSQSSRLYARIKKEVARAGGSPGAFTPLGPGKGRTLLKHRCRLTVRSKTVFVDGKPVPLGLTSDKLDDALFFLRTLSNRPGIWLSSPEISGAYPNKAAIRWDRVRNKLPAKIRSLIKSNTKKGYCI